MRSVVLMCVLLLTAVACKVTNVRSARLLETPRSQHFYIGDAEDADVSVEEVVELTERSVDSLFVSYRNDDHHVLGAREVTLDLPVGFAAETRHCVDYGVPLQVGLFEDVARPGEGHALYDELESAFFVHGFS